MYMQYLLALTLLLAPTYAVRFNLLGLPTNLLMTWLFLLWLVFVVWIVSTGRFFEFFAWLRSELSTWHLALGTLFLLAGTASLFVGGFSQEKLGQFIVLFLQPIGTFVIARYCFASNQKVVSSNQRQEGIALAKDKGLGIKDGSSLVNAALLFVSVAGLYAIIQYFTLIGVPQAWWGNAQEPKRAVAFFLHPNFYALFVTPLLAFLIPVVSEQWSVNRIDARPNFQSKLSTVHYTLFTTAAWLLGAIGLLLSLSRGGWLGLAAAIGVFVLVSGNRRYLKGTAVLFACSLIVVLAVPNFRYRVLLPFQGEKSSVARFSLWRTGWHMVEDNPILGKGLLGFSNNWTQYNTDPGLEHYPAPHNIFLNFWVDTGLLGLVSFFGLIVLAFKRGWQNRKSSLALGLALACVALVIHGLVDIPYFKNDLALLFWLLYSFI